jgi:hypothetical protein
MNRTATAAVTAALAIVLAGCSGDDTRTASGRLDDTKYTKAVKAVTTTDTRTVPTYENKCKTTRSKNRSTTSCSRVKTGTKTETYTRTLKPGKSAKWCVELDGVNGRDDVWFRVSQSTHAKWNDKPEGVKVNKMPYTAKGC